MQSRLPRSRLGQGQQQAEQVLSPPQVLSGPQEGLQASPFLLQASSGDRDRALP